MPVTIKVNGTVNSLVHKFSNGISAATIRSCAGSRAMSPAATMWS